MTTSITNKAYRLPTICTLIPTTPGARELVNYAHKHDQGIVTEVPDHGLSLVISLEVLQNRDLRHEDPDNHAVCLLWLGRGLRAPHGPHRISWSEAPDWWSHKHCTIELNLNSGELRLRRRGKSDWLFVDKMQITIPDCRAMVFQKARAITLSDDVTFDIDWPQVAEHEWESYRAAKIGLARQLSVHPSCPREAESVCTNLKGEEKFARASNRSTRPDDITRRHSPASQDSEKLLKPEIVKYNIGSTPNSQVDLGVDKWNAELRAVKTIFVRDDADGENRMRHLREVDISFINKTQLCPYVISLFDWRDDPHINRIEMDMEYCHEGDLSKHMLEARQNIKSVMFQLCSALLFLKSKLVVHRDIKPQNILVVREGIKDDADYSFRVKLADYGISNFTDTKRYTSCGTDFYVAPELVKGLEEHQYQVDIFSLGVVIAEILGAFGWPVDHDLKYAEVIKKVRKFRRGNVVASLLRRMTQLRSIDRPDAHEVLRQVCSEGPLIEGLEKFSDFRPDPTQRLSNLGSQTVPKLAIRHKDDDKPMPDAAAKSDSVLPGIALKDNLAIERALSKAVKEAPTRPYLAKNSATSNRSLRSLKLEQTSQGFSRQYGIRKSGRLASSTYSSGSSCRSLCSG